jgi:hypothetical protein
MAQYKGTIFFQANSGLSGWTEILYPAATSPGAAGAAMLAVVALRKAILHVDCAITNVTISDVAISGDSIILLGDPVQGTATGVEGYLPLDSALLIRWTVDVFTRNKTYVRGIPAHTVVDGLCIFPVLFLGSLDAWLEGVQANCVFKGINTINDTPPPARIVGYKPASNGVAVAKIARRKVGRPFGLSRGRRLAG